MCSPAAFKPALIVVDVQEDFCPPNGSLVIPHGRDIAGPINNLLDLPFALKLATRDWHPHNHVSFATNHHHHQQAPSSSSGSDSTTTNPPPPPQSQSPSPSQPQPFTSSTKIVHPSHPDQWYTTTLWPVHCVQDTPGAALIPELHADKLHGIVDKGTNATVEMYSAFYDPFRISDSGLAARLHAAAVTHVFVVGLAADFCVRATAEDAVKEGFATYVVEEATRSSRPEQWPVCRREITNKGVSIISIDGDEIARVKGLA